MPYVEKEKVKEFRNAIKKAFPEMKFSVVRDHGTCVNVCVLAAKDPAWAKYAGRNEQVNHFYVADHFKDEPVVRDVLLKLVAIVKEDQRELVYDMDYGSVPNYYVHLAIGKWDRPFELLEN